MWNGSVQDPVGQEGGDFTVKRKRPKANDNFTMIPITADKADIPCLEFNKKNILISFLFFSFKSMICTINLQNRILND